MTPGGLAADLVIGILVIVVAWYVVGAQLARLNATRLLRLAAELLRPLGREGSVRGLGGQGFEVQLINVRKPFRTLQAVIWLTPRELLPVWLLAKARGRTDILAIAADTLAPSGRSFEVVDPESPVGRRALRREAARGRASEDVEFAGRPMRLFSSDLPTARRALQSIESARPPGAYRVVRLSVSPDPPNLALSLANPEALTNAKGRFSGWLVKVAQIVASGII